MKLVILVFLLIPVSSVAESESCGVAKQMVRSQINSGQYYLNANAAHELRIGNTELYCRWLARVYGELNKSFDNIQYFPQMCGVDHRSNKMNHLRENSHRAANTLFRLTNKAYGASSGICNLDYDNEVIPRNVLVYVVRTFETKQAHF